MPAGTARAGIPLVALLLAACYGVETGAGPPAGVVAESSAPEVYVALTRGASGVEVGGGGPVRVLDGEGQPIAELPAGTVARAATQGDRVGLHVAGMRLGPSLTLELWPRDSGTVRIADREYRGRVAITATTTGLLVVNRVGIEDYLAGVVNAEMGRRAPGEEAALEAQAIVSRTFALRVVGRWRTQGFDLLATISDQAYTGVASETPAGRAAVAATRGLVITYADQPIEAFFHSTCGGRTAGGAEAFVNGGLPYLQSVVDQGPTGQSWCAISPRYQWREEWTGEQLRATLRTTLPAAAGVSATRVTEVRDVVVTDRSSSGRVASIRIQLGTSGVPVTGQTIRHVLRPEGAPLLRSTTFEVQATRSANRLIRLVLEGHGNGHGVGMCQWGAVGRARAGYGAEQIVAAYFPGTTLERRW
ncbi:MAG TPA: SpoIID/LytB domain-containing protein [Gemmatimonadales bacterium]